MEENKSLPVGFVKYEVAGQEVKLSFDIVRGALVHGDRTKVTEQDLMQFISICKFNQLNPFLNEAYLVTYDGQSGHSATMIVSKEAYLKRADACPNYEGIQAGVIVRNKSGEIVENEGCFVADGEVLVGGWAKVYRKGLRFPVVARVNLREYDSGKSLWKAKPSTMIAKVAKVQALREAFPSQLGAMYTEDEVLTQSVQDAVYTEIKEEANQQTIGFGQQPASSAQPAAEQPAEAPAQPAFME